MSGYDDLTSDSCWPDRTDRGDIERSAVLAVLRRFETGRDSAAECLLTLQVLGLRETPPEVRCKPLSTRQRRQAAKRAERVSDQSEREAG